MTADQFMEWLAQECGYIAPMQMSQGKWVGLRKKMFTWSIDRGQMFDMNGVEDCWCYHSLAEAVHYYLPWQGAGAVGEPEGWHRHPGTGRRVAGPEGAIDENGKRIEPGQAYISP